jgi:hypothetical protein
MSAIKEEVAEIYGRVDKEKMKLAELGQAVERGFRELKASIPCMGVYQSKPCRAVENSKTQCILKYYCELKILENN